MTYRKPDFKKVNICANEILVASNNITLFPVCVKPVVDEWSDIQIRSFDYAIKHNVDIKAFGSDSAVIHELNGRYLLFYNNKQVKPRIRFSILHEFGHYYLGHSMYTEDKDDYKICEIEANCFAAQILMPEQVINELKRRGACITDKYLMDTFGVSKEAADKRLSTLNKTQYSWRDEGEKIYDETILFKYMNFIDSILPKCNPRNNLCDDIDRQLERDSWIFDSRGRYGTY